MDRIAEKISAAGVSVVVVRQRASPSGVRGRLSQSYAIANAGTRKPRKPISSDTGATNVPKKVISHAFDWVKKKSSIGELFGVVMK